MVNTRETKKIEKIISKSDLIKKCVTLSENPLIARLFTCDKIIEKKGKVSDLDFSKLKENEFCIMESKTRIRFFADTWNGYYQIKLV